MTANELDIQVMDLVRKLELNPLLPHLESVGSGQIMEVKDESGKHNQYYQWLHCLMKLRKPKQVVELGAAAGISTIMMATALPNDSKLISVDNDPQSWRWMKQDYPQVIKILGDDLDLSIYKDLDLGATDIWFIDSLHEEQQLRKEVELYTPFWKPGSIVIMDDIHLNEGMNRVWDELTYDKHDITIPCHYSGFGLFIV